nr:hypothetical protein [Bacillus sp. FJAT-45037]
MFVRTSKGVTLTQEGETLFRYISPALGLIDTAFYHKVTIVQMS